MESARKVHLTTTVASRGHDAHVVTITSAMDPVLELLRLPGGDELPSQRDHDDLGVRVELQAAGDGGDVLAPACASLSREDPDARDSGVGEGSCSSPSVDGARREVGYEGSVAR